MVIRFVGQRKRVLPSWVQLDRWFAEGANSRLHRGIRAVLAERVAEERERMRVLPERMPALDPVWARDGGSPQSRSVSDP
jgi:hypothetical protein